MMQQLKVRKQRIVPRPALQPILNYLQNTTRHPKAIQIARELKVNYITVLKNLEILESEGKVECYKKPDHVITRYWKIKSSRRAK